jgi:hypothetical protein
VLNRVPIHVCLLEEMTSIINQEYNSLTKKGTSDKGCYPNPRKKIPIFPELI